MAKDKEVAMRISRELSCPRCGNGDFEQGASAGQSLNIQCKNCGHRMSVAVLGVCPLGCIGRVEGYLILEE